MKKTTTAIQNDETIWSANGSQRPSVRELAIPKLRGLATGLGVATLSDEAIRVLDLLTGEWTAERAKGNPPWPSDITDDGTPFEYSVALGDDKPELRLLAETRGVRSDPASSWAAGLALNERLSEEYGVDLSRFNRVGSLFAPLPSIAAHFTIWHAAVLCEARAPAFKVYLNPQVVGRAGARPLVERALAELQLPLAVEFLRRYLPQSFDVPYFSLDLDSGPAARAKVYVSEVGATSERIDDVLFEAGLTQRGQARQWIEALTGGSEPHDGRPIQVCFGFRQGEQVPEITLHVPVRSYAESDAQALTSACDLLSDSNASLLRSAVQAMAQRPLEHGRSLISYVSLRPRGGSLGVTVYLSPELYAIAAPRASLADAVPAHSFIRELGEQTAADRQMTLDSVLQVIASQREALARHPFFTRLMAGGCHADAREIARRGAFFVMGFQDVLRLVTQLTEDPGLREYAEIHGQEDKGHDAWYLHDLAQLGVQCDLRDAFSDDLRQSRDTIYAQIADVLRSKEDASRIAVVLSLEAAGSEFFESIIKFFERLGCDNDLLYFSRSHQHVEQSHEIFESDSSERLKAHAIGISAYEEAVSVVERTFRTMQEFFDDMVRHLERGDVATRQAS